MGKSAPLIGCAVLLGALGLLSAGSVTGLPAGVGAEKKPFTHMQHVRIEWFQGRGAEMPRDCRGCHDYSESTARDPSDFCVKCHSANVKSGKPTLGLPKEAQERWRNLTQRRDHTRTFGHHDHRELECRVCHRPSMLDGDVRTTDELLRLAGTGACLRCHDPNRDPAPPGSARAPDQVTAFVGGLNKRLGEREQASFDHRQHLEAKMTTGRERPGLAVCLPCHKPLAEKPGVQIGHEQIDRDGCAACHQPRDATAVIDFGFRDVPVASPSRMTFPHKPHLSAEALKNDDLAQACLACHEWRKGGTDVNWPLRPSWTAPGKSTYDRCVSCHSHRDKAEAVNLKHEGAFADTCVICHVAGLEGGSLKNDRPQTTVRRRKPGTVFRITTQAHPFITGRTADATCSDCHRAKIPLLPSRLGTRPFSHETHVPTPASPADCSRCHPGLETKGSSGEMVLYEPGACKRCHMGEEVPDPFAHDQSTERSVPTFPHSRHLSKEAATEPRLKDLQCMACHGPDDGTMKPVIGFKKDVQKCVACHNHKDEAAVKITGGKDLKYVESCIACHGQVIPDPRPDDILNNGHAEVSFTRPAQHHPMPDKQRCETCHAAAWEGSRKELGEPTSADITGGVHKDPKSQYTEAGDCGLCHWSDGLKNQNRRAVNVTRDQLFERWKAVTTYGSPR